MSGSGDLLMKLLFAGLLIISSLCSAKTFVSGTDDIPMMEGFKECDPETQGLFSVPEGRIVSVVARGRNNWNKVVTFMKLPLKTWGGSLKVLHPRNPFVSKETAEKINHHVSKENNGIPLSAWIL